MLPRDYRLKRSRDFSRVRRYGRSSGGTSALAALYVLPRRSPEVLVGFSVSKRVGNATTRNRVKRLLREAVRRRLSMLHPGQQLVFIARPAAADASFEQIDRAVATLLVKTGAIRHPAKAANNG